MYGGMTFWLMAFVDKTTHSIVRVSVMIYDGGRGAPSPWPSDAGVPAALTWVSGPSRQQAQDMMDDLLRRPEWAWTLELMPPEQLWNLKERQGCPHG